jgi:hypothetical protein
MSVTSRRMRTSIVVLLLGSLLDISNVAARQIRQEQRQEQRQKRYKESDLAEKANNPTSFSSKGLWEDEFGRLSEVVHEYGRKQQQGISSSSSSSSFSSTSNNIKSSHLRRTSHSTIIASPRSLSAQRWNAVSKSYQESNHHTDGLTLIQDDKNPNPTFGTRKSINSGINQHVREQQIEAFLAAEELQEIMVMSLLMSMTLDVSWIDRNRYLQFACT